MGYSHPSVTQVLYSIIRARYATRYRYFALGGETGPLGHSCNCGPDLPSYAFPRPRLAPQPVTHIHIPHSPPLLPETVPLLRIGRGDQAFRPLLQLRARSAFIRVSPNSALTSVCHPHPHTQFPALVTRSGTAISHRAGFRPLLQLRARAALKSLSSTSTRTAVCYPHLHTPFPRLFSRTVVPSFSHRVGRSCL